MDNLSDIYTGESEEDFTETITWIKSRDSYNRDLTVSECIRQSNSTLSEQETLTRRLIGLYRDRNSDKDKDNIREAEEDLSKQRNIRKKAERFLCRFEPNKRIKEVVE